MRSTSTPIQSLALAIAITLVALIAPVANAQWVTRPSDETIKKTRGLVHETFESQSMKTTVGYSVVLPPGYRVSEKQYPVVYWLHGGGGNECTSLFTSKSWDKLYETAKIEETILVYPNGFRSGYMDHHDGKVMIESMIIQELIPRIDARFRTIASRSGRAVHGFSMGASGALKFAIKYPDLFCSAVAYGGGSIDLEKTKDPFVLKILANNLAMDAKLIRQNNTFHFLKKNHEAVKRNKIEFLLVCGQKDSWKESAVNFHSALKAADIPCQLKLVPDVGHEIGELVQAEGETAVQFQDQVFSCTLDTKNH